MGILFDLKEAHRDFADMWDEARVDLESEPDPVSRLGYRVAWVGTFIAGFVLSFLVSGIIGFLTTLGNDTAGDAAALFGGSVWIALWVSVWLRSYTFKEDDSPGVDLTK